MKIVAGDKCSDCMNCQYWTADGQRATCTAVGSPMYGRRGFDPEQMAPLPCWGASERIGARGHFKLRTRSAVLGHRG